MKALRCMILTMVLMSAMVSANDSDPLEGAEAFASQWLGKVDKGLYQPSWEVGSGFFQEMVSSEAWVDALTQTRQPLGEVGQRKLVTQRFMKQLPNVPDGEYAVLQYKSGFAEKEQATETVTLAREEDQWKLLGYYIR